MSLIDRMIRAAKLDVSLYEEVEADPAATNQALLVVVVARSSRRGKNTRYLRSVLPSTMLKRRSLKGAANWAVGSPFHRYLLKSHGFSVKVEHAAHQRLTDARDDFDGFQRL